MPRPLHRSSCPASWISTSWRTRTVRLAPLACQRMRRSKGCRSALVLRIFSIVCLLHIWARCQVSAETVVFADSLEALGIPVDGSLDDDQATQARFGLLASLLGEVVRTSPQNFPQSLLSVQSMIRVQPLIQCAILLSFLLPAVMWLIQRVYEVHKNYETMHRDTVGLSR